MSRADWDLMRAFSATAETGTLSAAARKLGLAQPTLSRQVAALEAKLGVTLFERIGRRLVLTATGQNLASHAREMADAADRMALAAVAQSHDITGRICISATDACAVQFLPGIAEQIRRQAPHLTIAIVATDSISDLRRREADIAIRHVRPTQGDLVSRFIGNLAADFYAAETWVARHGRPRSPADLAGVELLGFEPVASFIDHLVRMGMAARIEQCRIVSGNAVVLWEMLRRGLGVGMMLRAAAERSAGLVRLFPDMPATPVPVWIVTHRELRTSRPLRLVFDVIARDLRRHLAADVGSPGR
jgi:DNA-binding transcriptional LysR family regulator